jgi:DNA ligase-associated metallophosphoesterase
MLLPERAVFWQEQKMLLLADLHLGKADHFSRSGVRIPTSVHVHDLERLQALLDAWRPSSVVFLGDLFHSSVTEEFEVFADFITGQSSTQWTLVKGNHDLVSSFRFAELGIKMVESLFLGPFWLTHAPSPHTQAYNIAGHLHPGVVLSGKAHQHLRLPCYYFGASEGVLPAFGSFTGCISMPVKKGVRIFAVAGGRVLPLHKQP